MPLHFMHGALGRLFSACSICFQLSATVLSDIKSFTNSAKKLENGNSVVMAGQWEKVPDHTMTFQATAKISYIKSKTF